MTRTSTGSVRSEGQHGKRGMTTEKDLAEADRLADEVRTLRQQLDGVAPGPERKAKRKRMLLQIDVRRCMMAALNPKKYGREKLGGGNE
jgi:hypothetical protein